MSIGKRTRFEILKRDRFRCAYCGKAGDAAGLHVDHVVPRAMGGADEPSNLVAACTACNMGKSAVPLQQSLIGDVYDPDQGWEADGAACMLEYYFPGTIPSLLCDEPNPEIQAAIAEELAR